MVSPTKAPEPPRVALPAKTPEPPHASPARPPTLSDEVGLLDAALAALRARDPRRALAALDTYDARFPAGKLAPEAMVARIEATHAVGNAGRTRELAAKFLATHARSPLAQRVREIVRSLPP